MQRAKSFFYVSLGVLALAVTFHLGTQSAEGQAAGSIVDAFPTASRTSVQVVLDNGDVWWFEHNSGRGEFVGNIFTVPTQTTETTWGRIKAERR